MEMWTSPENMSDGDAIEQELHDFYLLQRKYEEVLDEDERCGN